MKHPIRVMSVKAVSLQLQKSRPPQLVVMADGDVPTRGWGKGLLLPVTHVAPPADGVQEFEFVASPPSEFVPQVISPVEAEITSPVDIVNYWGPGVPLKGVRVLARTNAKERLLADPQAFIQSEDNPVPWPWVALGGTAPGTMPALIGKTLRVYHTDDALTKDLREDRANIELGADERIVEVWIG